MITRRSFFGLLGGALAAEAARKIYVLPPLGGWQCKGGLITPGEALFFLPGKDLKYRFTYRNVVTGHVSDATPNMRGWSIPSPTRKEMWWIPADDGWEF